jgi:hypothetical protein
MKYPVWLAIALMLAVATPAQAQVARHRPHAVQWDSTAALPAPVGPTAESGLLPTLLSWLAPRRHPTSGPRGDAEAWTRFSRQRGDKGGSSDYMMRGIVVTAALSAGVVGLTFVAKSSRAPRLGVKPCRSGAMLALQGVF